MRSTPMDYTCFLTFKKFIEDAIAYDFDGYVFVITIQVIIIIKH